MKQFAKFIDEWNVELAPSTAEIDGMLYLSLSEEDYARIGYKPLIQCDEIPMGEYIIKYEEHDDYIQEVYEITKTWEECEAERIANLELTRADVERAIYVSMGIDFEDLVNYLSAIQIEGVDIKRLKIELQANHFVRRHPYIATIGQILGYTELELNTLFETKTLPPKENPFIKQTVEEPQQEEVVEENNKKETTDENESQIEENNKEDNGEE